MHDVITGMTSRRLDRDLTGIGEGSARLLGTSNPDALSSAAASFTFTRSSAARAARSFS